MHIQTPALRADSTKAAARTPSLPHRRSFLALRDRPGAVHRLRAFVGAAVAGLPYAVDEIELIAVELVTNAVRHAVRKLTNAEDLWPIGVEMTAGLRYVHLAVSDLDPQPMPAADTGGLLAEQGRGLAIVDNLAVARWVTYTRHGKTVHVIITGSDVTLTPEEIESIRGPR